MAEYFSSFCGSYCSTPSPYVMVTSGAHRTVRTFPSYVDEQRSKRNQSLRARRDGRDAECPDGRIIGWIAAGLLGSGAHWRSPPGGNSPIVSVGRYAWGFDRASHGQVRTRLDARAVVGELTAVCAAKSQPTEFLGDSWGVAVLTEAELWPILPPRCLLASENAHSAPGFGASRMSFSGDVGIPGVSRNCEVGFFINFNVARLVDGVRRVV
jgi:hypothetical protein